ncbi:MAG: ATP cone domain-containing protein [bacterium]
MAKEVTKKDGTKEPFDAGKIKSAIAGAANDAGVAEDKKNEIVEQVSAKVIAMAEGKEEITSSEIKESILSELDSAEPSVSAAWKKHDEEKAAA